MGISQSLFLQSDMKARIVRGILNTLQDSNASAIIVTLDCLQLVIGSHYECFRSYVGAFFDALIEKFRDSKVHMLDSLEFWFPFKISNSVRQRERFVILTSTLCRFQ